MEKDVKYYERAVENQFCCFKYLRVVKWKNEHSVKVMSGRYTLVYCRGASQFEAIKNAYINLLERQKKEMSPEQWEKHLNRKIVCYGGRIIETLPP